MKKGSLVYDETYPAAASSRVADLETRLGTTLPKEYRTYLATQDGGTLAGYNNQGLEVIFGVGEVPEWASLWHVLEGWQDVLPAGFIPVGSDAGGSFFLLAISGHDKGSVWYWSSELEEDDSGEAVSVQHERLSDSWDEFLSSVTAD